MKKANLMRGWLEYWTGPDRRQEEIGAVREVLAAAGLTVSGLRATENDPPDCEACVDDLWSGIEHTELVDQKTLQRSLKALKTGQENEAVYLVWTAPVLIARLQAIIARKDVERASAYERYVLVIVTDEFFLDRETVTNFLVDATFEANRITDAFLALSYHPASDGKGCIPVFRLALKKAPPADHPCCNAPA